MNRHSFLTVEVLRNSRNPTRRGSMHIFNLQLCPLPCSPGLHQNRVILSWGRCGEQRSGRERVPVSSSVGQVHCSTPNLQEQRGATRKKTQPIPKARKYLVWGRGR